MPLLQRGLAARPAGVCEGKRRRRIARGSIVAAVSASFVLSIGAPAEAARYIYYPGESVTVGSSLCTGAFGIKLAGKNYELTGGHCGPVGSAVKTKTGHVLGKIVRSGYTPTAQGFQGFDHSLITITVAGGTPWQQVKNPVTERLIYPTGKVYDLMEARRLVSGFKVAKSGRTTGVTSGNIVSYTRWGVDIAYCARMRTLPGDSGGPVFRSEGQGLSAVGMTVAWDGKQGDVGCFISMDEVLRRWGAALPTYSGDKRAHPPVVAAASVMGPENAPHVAPDLNGLPYLDPAELRSADLP